MNAYVALSAITLVLVGQIALALRLQGPARVLVLVQAGYWILSYVVRPFILVAVRPAPSYADSIADLRLARDGYTGSVDQALIPVLVGLAVYVMLLALFTRKLRISREGTPWNRRLSGGPFVVMYVVGWLFRIADTYVHGSFFATFAGLATAGAAGLFVFLRPERKSGVPWILGGVLLMELLWAALSASKAPVLAALLALALRIGGVAMTRKTILSAITLALVFLSGFSALQGLKTDASVARDLQIADSNYPATLAPGLDIVRRFDLFSAVTDATTMGPGRWMTVDEMINRAFSAVTPELVTNGVKVSAGTAWTAEVRASTRPEANVNVSLAEGSIAEGYALAGYLGVIVESSILFVALLLTCRLLESGRLPAVVWGLLLVSFPLLFERGAFGALEIASKAAQIALVVWLARLMLTARRPSTRVPPAPLGASAGTVA